MTPVSPVVQGFEELEVIFAKDQPEYLPLPALCRSDSPDLPVTSRWRLTPAEREKIAGGADIVLTLLTFGDPLQPITLEVLHSYQSPFCYTQV